MILDDGVVSSAQHSVIDDAEANQASREVRKGVYIYIYIYCLSLFA